MELIRDELDQLLQNLTTVEAERFRSALDRMSAELEAHLDFEESALIPMLSEIPFPVA